MASSAPTRPPANTLLQLSTTLLTAALGCGIGLLFFLNLPPRPKTDPENQTPSLAGDPLSIVQFPKFDADPVGDSVRDVSRSHQQLIPDHLPPLDAASASTPADAAEFTAADEMFDAFPPEDLPPAELQPEFEPEPTPAMRRITPRSATGRGGAMQPRGVVSTPRANFGGRQPRQQMPIPGQSAPDLNSAAAQHAKLAAELRGVREQLLQVTKQLAAREREAATPKNPAPAELTPRATSESATTNPTPATEPAPAGNTGDPSPSPAESPEPVFDPFADPDPTTVPAAEPAPVPTPESEPQAEPEPAIEPTPATEPEPEPQPESEPPATPEPLPMPDPAPQPSSEPGPIPEPTPPVLPSPPPTPVEPTVPEPLPEPVPTPAPQEPWPVPEPAPAPPVAPSPASELSSAQSTEPVIPSAALRVPAVPNERLAGMHLVPPPVAEVSPVSPLVNRDLWENVSEPAAAVSSSREPKAAAAAAPPLNGGTVVRSTKVEPRGAGAGLPASMSGIRESFSEGLEELPRPVVPAPVWLRSLFGGRRSVERQTAEEVASGRQPSAAPGPLVSPSKSAMFAPQPREGVRTAAASVSDTGEGGVRQAAHTESASDADVYSNRMQSRYRSLREGHNKPGKMFDPHAYVPPAWLEDAAGTE